MAKKKDNTLLYAGIAAAALLLFKKKDSGMAGVGASKEFTILGRVISTEYRNTSSYGNPSYYVRIETADGRIITGYTAPNASLGYSITNSDYKKKYWNFICKEGARGLVIHYAR